MSNSNPDQTSEAEVTTDATATATDTPDSPTTHLPEIPEPRHPYLTGATADAEWNAKTLDAQELITDTHEDWESLEEDIFDGVGDEQAAANAFKVWSATAEHVGFRLMYPYRLERMVRLRFRLLHSRSLNREVQEICKRYAA